MLEPYEWKRSCTVLRRESGSNPADLVDYGPLAKALGGEVIEISPHSRHHISPLDLASGWDGDGKLLIIHCASGWNNVVITGIVDFVSVGRPVFYSE